MTVCSWNEMAINLINPQHSQEIMSCLIQNQTSAVHQSLSENFAFCILFSNSVNEMALTDGKSHTFLKTLVSGNNKELKHAAFLSHGRQPEVRCFRI